MDHGKPVPCSYRCRVLCRNAYLDNTKVAMGTIALAFREVRENGLKILFGFAVFLALVFLA